MLTGTLGQAVIKTSAVRPEHHVIEAPALVFQDQEEIKAAFRKGALERDFVCVLRFQGPQANGMPELHALTPVLGSVQDRGFRVALLTDGRMSGASGKVPAAIHVTPEAAAGGAIARLRDGDMLRLDAAAGRLDVLGDAAEFAARAPAQADLSANASGIGRELFAAFRANVGPAEKGAAVVVWPRCLTMVTVCVARDARGARDASRRSIRKERAEERSGAYGRPVRARPADRALRAQGVRDGGHLGHQFLRPVRCRARQDARAAPDPGHAWRGRRRRRARPVDGRAGRAHRGA